VKNENTVETVLLNQIMSRENRNRWIWIWLILSIIVMITSIYFNWLHWGNLAFVNDDIHREFVTPVRLLKGEILYKDFNFVYGPFPPYLNSLIIQIPFLDTFTKLRFTTLTLFLLNLLFLWLICRDIELTWIFGPVLFGIASWTSSYTFNPSSFNTAYATLFATFGIWCAIRTLRSEKWAWYGVGIACAGAFLCKPEGLFVVGLAFVGAYILDYRTQKILINSNIFRWIGGFLLLAVPFIVFLSYKGLTWQVFTEGILQRRFQKNLSAGFIEQYNYFYGINHVLVIIAGISFIAIVFYLINRYQRKKNFQFWLVLSISIFIGSVLAYLGQLSRITDDYQNLGDFFGGILGYWWYRQLPEGSPKNGFFIFWLSSLGGWLRPLFHIGALVIPFRVGGGMLLAVIFWFLMLPEFYQRNNTNLNIESKRLKNVFITIGCVAVLIYGFTGLYQSWNSQWKHSTVEFKTKYGNFLANHNEESTQLGIEIINWIQINLDEDKRMVALEGLPIELVLGRLPCIPLSQQNYQIYQGDTQRIISIFDTRQDIEYILVHIRPGGYNFGIQDYKLADYLDTKWKQVKRFNVPDQLNSLTQMSPERKYDSGLVKGFILYGRKIS